MMWASCPIILIMRRIIFSLLLAISFNSYADSPELNIEMFTAIEISNLFDKTDNIVVDDLIDLIDKEEKIGICVKDYIKKQTKSYAKIAQNNLYDLIHNFDKIASKIYGKKSVED